MPHRPPYGSATDSRASEGRLIHESWGLGPGAPFLYLLHQINPEKYAHLFQLRIVEMILNKLYAGIEIRRVEFVGDVPAERTELSSLLNDGMQEGHSEQHRFPLRQIGNVEEVLSDAGVGPLQAGPDTLGRLIREFDRHLYASKQTLTICSNC